MVMVYPGCLRPQVCLRLELQAAKSSLSVPTCFLTILKLSVHFPSCVQQTSNQPKILSAAGRELNNTVRVSSPSLLKGSKLGPKPCCRWYMCSFCASCAWLELLINKDV